MNRRWLNLGRKRDDSEGAVDLSECPSSRCSCEKCQFCGNHKHTGIHGPFVGEKVGSRPYGHAFVSSEVVGSAAERGGF